MWAPATEQRRGAPPASAPVSSNRAPCESSSLGPAADLFGCAGGSRTRREVFPFRLAVVVLVAAASQRSERAALATVASPFEVCEGALRMTRKREMGRTDWRTRKCSAEGHWPQKKLARRLNSSNEPHLFAGSEPQVRAQSTTRRIN